jgi:hypothetical protein
LIQHRSASFIGFSRPFFHALRYKKEAQPSVPHLQPEFVPGDDGRLAIFPLFVPTLALSPRFLTSDLPASVDIEYSGAGKLLSTLFFNNNWKETARDWAPLHGNEQRIQDLFNAIPPSRAVLCAYACFLYKIGAVMLPLPLIAIAAKLGGQDRGSLLSQATVFYLDGILRRIIQGGSTSMLARDDVRNTVLSLLDELVEQGSSTAYKLREDFVTPRQ